MTLVVGRIVDGKTYIFADTALTSAIQQKINPYTDGCLKCYIVHERLALAFADTASSFERSCKALLSLRSAAEIVRYATTAQAEGWQVEILVAEAGSSTLWTVKNGKAIESSAGFLGDAGAFNSFQTYLNAPNAILNIPPTDTVQIGFHRLPEPVSDPNIYKNMFDSFKAVVEDAAHPTVGGVVIPLCTDNGSFQYLNYAAVFSPLEKTMLNGQPIPFGTAANGGYAVELCTDENAVEPSFYFLQGGFGLLFPRNNTGFRRASVLKIESPAHFVLESGKVLGRRLKSCYATPDHFGIAGESLYTSGKYEEAVQCYEQGNGYEKLKERPLLRDRYIGQFSAALYQCGNRDKALTILCACIAEQPMESDFCRQILRQIT